MKREGDSNRRNLLVKCKCKNRCRESEVASTALHEEMFHYGLAMGSYWRDDL